jgi:microcompartment protein CcmK/EutM
MILARVKGNVVSTHKNQYLVGHKLMLVRPIDLEGNYTGKKDYIALDNIDSGIGDIVLVVKEGAAVQQILGNSDTPVNMMITCIVDDLDLLKEEVNN